jgi:putative DNA primase/helicase
MSIDFNRARETASLVETVSRYVELKPKGSEYEGLCPFHGEKTPSFQLFQGDKGWLYHCKGCGASGDVIDFVAEINRETLIQAAKRIEGGQFPDTAGPPLPPPGLPPEAWSPCLAPESAVFDQGRVWNHRKLKHVSHNNASRVDCYRTPAGAPICYVARFDRDDGGKTIVTTTYATHADGRADWVTIRPSQPYPLFGLDAIAADPTKPVLVFEGEKKRALAEPLLAGYICTTILGGTSGATCTDWAPLYGRRVVLWPDNNEPGRKCMDRVAKELAGRAESLSVVDVSSLPEGHDVADLIDTGADVEDWLGWRITPYTPPAQAAKSEERKSRAESRAAEPREATFADALLADMPPEYSDDHLAQEFAETFHKRCCYCNELMTWMVWDGQRWAPDRTLAVRDLIRVRICRAKATEAANRLDLGKRGGAIAGALGSARAVGSVDTLARADRRIAVTTDQFDADQWALNTPGGIVNLQTGELREALPSDYCSRLAGATPQGDCPQWVEFLMQCCRGDAEMVGYLQRWLGYCITGSVREQKFLFVHGPGGSGKSTLMEVARHVLGDYAQTTPMETFMRKQRDGGVPIDIAEMKGSRFITAEEITEGRSWDEQKLKLCTGGVKLKARFMNRNFFEFEPTAKFTFAGNNTPQLDNVDEAMKRRFVMIPFLNQMPEDSRDNTLVDRLKAEADGILAWMVEGCRQWQREGLKVPPSIKAATAEYFSDQDVISQFIATRLDTTDRTRSEIDTVVYQAYSRWCDSVGEEARDKRRFLEAMKAKGVTQSGRTTANVDGRRVSGVTKLIGVRLKSPAEIDRDGVGDDWA